MTIETEVFEPIHHIVTNVGANFVAAVVRSRVSPRRDCARVLIEKDAPAAVLTPAVVLPEIEIVGAKVVEHQITEHRDAARVRCVDELFHIGWRAVRSFNSPRMRAVVAPRHAERKLAEWHDLHGIYAEFSEVVELRARLIEVGGHAALWRLTEGAEVQFIDNQFVPTGNREAWSLPREGRVIDNDRVANGARHRSRARVIFPQRRSRSGDHILVLRTCIDEVHIE